VRAMTHFFVRFHQYFFIIDNARVSGRPNAQPGCGLVPHSLRPHSALPPRALLDRTFTLLPTLSSNLVPGRPASPCLFECRNSRLSHLTRFRQTPKLSFMPLCPSDYEKHPNERDESVTN
jgi:hypothetical protein